LEIIIRKKEDRDNVGKAGNAARGEQGGVKAQDSVE